MLIEPIVRLSFIIIQLVADFPGMHFAAPSRGRWKISLVSGEYLEEALAGEVSFSKNARARRAFEVCFNC